MQLALGVVTVLLAVSASCADVLTIVLWLLRAGGDRRDRYWLFLVYGSHWILCFAIVVVVGVLLKRPGSWVLDRTCSGLLFSATLVGILREVEMLRIIITIDRRRRQWAVRFLIGSQALLVGLMHIEASRTGQPPNSTWILTAPILATIFWALCVFEYAFLLIFVVRQPSFHSTERHIKRWWHSSASSFAIILASALGSLACSGYDIWYCGKYPLEASDPRVGFYVYIGILPPFISISLSSLRLLRGRHRVAADAPCDQASHNDQKGVVSEPSIKDPRALDLEKALEKANQDDILDLQDILSSLEQEGLTANEHRSLVQLRCCIFGPRYSPSGFKKSLARDTAVPYRCNQAVAAMGMMETWKKAFREDDGF